MLQILSKNYYKILKKLPGEFVRSILKVALILGLCGYWSVILFGTFLQLN